MADLNYVIALPEIWMAVSGVALLMTGVFSKNDGKLARNLAYVVPLIAIWLILSGTTDRQLAFNGQFVVDTFANFTKILALAAVFASIVIGEPFIRREGMARFELPVLMIFSSLGMMMMISANHLISLYIGLELQSLALYVLAALRRDSLKATEAGLKYFVLGALSSGILLYGVSLIYGYTGTLQFDGLAQYLQTLTQTPFHNLGLLVGLIFLIVGVAFKISAVPFHMWTPDVYEGAPTPIVAFFAAAPKVAAMTLLCRILAGPFEELVGEWRQVIVFLSIASMLLGSVAAIGQSNIKRLMGYSSIGNMGYALIGLASATPDGVGSVLLYLTIYVVMTIGTFGIILSMRHKNGMAENIADLAGLARTRPWMAHFLAISMFSMAGIPPLAGFFAKYYVFFAAIDAGLYSLAIIGVLSSVISAVYYLRIIKVMYFDEPVHGFEPSDRPVLLVSTLCAMGVLLFCLVPQSLFDETKRAAEVLFAG